MKQKIILKGPVLSQSGYGEQARFALRALRSREDLFDIYIVPTNWGQTGWVSDANEERAWMDQRIAQTHVFTQQGGQFDISVQVTIPNEWERIAPINIGYTAGIETTKVAPVWLQKANEMDKVIVVSNHSKDVFEDTTYQGQNNQTGQIVNLTCQTPITAVNYPVRNFEKQKLNLKLDYDFNYLAISQWGPRKNFDNLVKWFLEENFDQEVGLVLKTSVKNNSIIDREHTGTRLKSLLRRFGGDNCKCKVYLLHGDLTPEEMNGLYQHSKIKALVSTAHGEGYGLPLFEAAYNGLPVVVSGWSGHCDFLYMPDARRKSGKKKPMFASVEYDLQNIQKEAVWNNVIQADSQWAYPREASFKRRLREVRSEHARFKRNAKKLQKYLVENFTEELMYRSFCNNVVGKSSESPSPINKISFCIPTNGARIEKTLKTIESIKREAVNIPHEIIIAGNVEPFSKVKGVKLIDKKQESLSRKVSVLRNSSADASTGDVIVWCDDDIVLGKNWYDTTVKYSENNGWNVLGCKILNPDGTRHWDRGTINPRKLVSYDYPCYSRNLLQTSGFFMVRRNVFEKARWNEDRLAYADRQEKQIPEDLQYSLDLLSLGYELAFNELSHVWHNDDSYTEWGEQTLLKELISKQSGLSFFPPPCEEFFGEAK
jgi:glycosyltransferase involved in cell wall biosynthesis